MHRYIDESPAVPDRPLPREDGHRRRSSTCASPTRCSSRSGTATTSRRVQITMAESFGVEDRGHFYDPVGALRDVVVNHLMQVVAAGGDGGARRPRRPTRSRTRCYALFSAMPAADPAHYVRGQYDGYRDIDGVAAGLDHRDLRRAAPGDRQLALVGRAVLHPHRQAPAGHADRAAARLPPAAAAGLPRRPRRARPSRTSSSSSSTRPPASGCCSRRSAADARRAGADQPRHGVRRRGRRGPDALRGAAARGDARRQHRASRARTASRRPGA